MGKKKWEEIQYEDIQIGDVVRHTVVLGGESAGRLVQQGKVSSRDSRDNSYRLGTGLWLYPNEAYVEDYAEVEEVSVYRKVPKPAPFVFPEGMGAVIKGRNGSGAKQERTHVKVGEDKFFNVELGCIATKYELGLFYVDLVVLSEGYVEEKETTE